jgi:beta-D-xylosidase 4
VDEGVVPISVVDTAVTRSYTKMIANGLFDKDLSPNAHLGPMDVDTPRARQIVLEASQQAMTLLKNDGDLLPLKPSQTIALIGPHLNATEQMLSIYYGGNALAWEHSPYMSLSKRLDASKIKGHAFGCGVKNIPPNPPGPGAPTMMPTVDPKKQGGYGDLDYTECDDDSGFPEAAALAASADVAVVFVGLHPHEYVYNGNSDSREDEGKDRAHTALPGLQSELIQAVVKANPKTVVVLIHGGSVSIDWAAANAPAILDAHYPGELGGDAIASVLYGDVTPSGRVTQTVYPESFSASRPISDMSLRGYDGAHGITYMHYTGRPLYAFGFGLSYTSFKFAWDPMTGGVGEKETSTVAMAALHKRHYKLSSAERASLTPGYSVVVTNTGQASAACSVLAFLDSSGALGGKSDAAANGELVDFGRTQVLAPGQSETVRLTIAPTVLSLVDEKGTERIAPGVYGVTIGVQGSAEDQDVGDASGLLRGSLQVSGKPVEVFSLAEAKARANTKTHGLFGASPY